MQELGNIGQEGLGSACTVRNDMVRVRITEVHMRCGARSEKRGVEPKHLRTAIWLFLIYLAVLD